MTQSATTATIRRATPRFQRLHTTRVLACTALLLATSCTWNSRIRTLGPPPENARSGITMLALNAPYAAALDCQRNNCNHWYSVVIDEPGTLHVEVQTELLADHPLIRLVLRELGQPILGQVVGVRGEPIELQRDIGEGLYGVLVQGGGGFHPYTLTVSFEPRVR